MNQENYQNLAQIVEDAVQKTAETKTLLFKFFYPQMEEEFKRLGYRDNPTDGAIQKILILRLDAIGDFILMTPAIRAIRENFPAAYITLVVTQKVYPIAELCPYVNEIIPFYTPYNSSTINSDTVEILATAFEFSARNFLHRHFDACFTFVNDTTHAIMAYFSGAQLRIGLADSTAKDIFTHQTEIDHTKFINHCEKNLQILSCCGLKISSENLNLWYGLEDIHCAKNILKNFAQNRVKVALGIGASIPERKYPVEKYLVALKRIIEKGASIIILGGADEIEDAKFLEDNLPAEFVKNIVKLKPNWRTTSAIMSMTDIYIGNDTGTQHVAAALKKPVIVLSRESKDRERVNGPKCEHLSFKPWQTKSVTLQPEHSLGDCAKNLKLFCIAGFSHCIAQIEPSEIVDAYDEIMKTHIKI